MMVVNGTPMAGVFVETKYDTAIVSSRESHTRDTAKAIVIQRQNRATRMNTVKIMLFDGISANAFEANAPS
jgi:hypothetical protein